MSLLLFPRRGGGGFYISGTGGSEGDDSPRVAFCFLRGFGGELSFLLCLHLDVGQRDRSEERRVGKECRL